MIFVWKVPYLVGEELSEECRYNLNISYSSRVVVNLVVAIGHIFSTEITSIFEIS